MNLLNPLNPLSPLNPNNPNNPIHHNNLGGGGETQQPVAVSPIPVSDLDIGIAFGGLILLVVFIVYRSTRRG